ncbi:MAG: PhnD/SsuA/transferrin family substrate-binding protein [Candidatus Thiodiazotropha sp.]
MTRRIVSLFISMALMFLHPSPAWPETSPSALQPISIGASVESSFEANEVEVEIIFSFLYNEMLKDLNQPIEVKLYESNTELEQKFRAGEIQAIFIDSTRILELEDIIHPSARYVVQFGDSLKQRFVLLARANDPRQTLPDYRNGKLSTCMGHMIGKRYLDVLLLHSGLPVTDEFFQETLTMRNINSTIIDLFFGKVDMALVPEYGLTLAIELNPQIDKQLRIVSRSEPLIYQAIGFRRDFPQDSIVAIESRFITQEPSKRLRRLFDLVKINTYYRLTEDALKETRALNEEYYRLMGNNF